MPEAVRFWRNFGGGITMRLPGEAKELCAFAVQ
jgi:hypothetical protein